MTRAVRAAKVATEAMEEAGTAGLVGSVVEAVRVAAAMVVEVSSAGKVAARRGKGRCGGAR